MFDTQFIGAKIALLHNNRILTKLRDEKPSIPWPGYWDLPGGGKEAAETIEQCIVRETMEEFNLALNISSIIWSRSYPSSTGPEKQAMFFVAPILKEDIGAVRLGNEGQEWKMMEISEYMTHDRVVPHHQARLSEYLQQQE